MKKLMVMMALAAATALTACGHDEVKSNGGVTFSGGPDWVNKGNGAFSGDKGKVFRGVGIAGGIRNPSMRRSSADVRARGEIAKTLDSYIAVLNKAYQRSTTAGDPTKSSDEQDVSEALKSYSQVQLSGAEIVDHWIAADGTEFALAELNLNGMKDGMDKMKELNAKVRDAVRANSDKAFDELAGEEAKAAQRK